MKDLWPKNFEVKDKKSPAMILQEQASILGSKTQNILKAEVKFQPPSDVIVNVRGLSLNAIAEMQKYPFRYDFNIVVPTFHNYQYKLFSIVHNLDYYPLMIFTEKDFLDELLNSDLITEIKVEKEGILVDSEEKFVNVLKLILNSNKIRRLIKLFLLESSTEELSYSN